MFQKNGRCSSDKPCHPVTPASAARAPLCSLSRSRSARPAAGARGLQLPAQVPPRSDAPPSLPAPSPRTRGLFTTRTGECKSPARASPAPGHRRSTHAHSLPQPGARAQPQSRAPGVAGQAGGEGAEGELLSPAARRPLNPRPAALPAPFPLFTCQQVPNFLGEGRGRGGAARGGHVGERGACGGRTCAERVTDGLGLRLPPRLWLAVPGSTAGPRFRTLPGRGSQRGSH